MLKINKSKVLSSVMLLSLVMQPITAFAYTKSEAVYANLNHNGTVGDITVNNHLAKLNKEMIEDEAVLSKIINLNGDEEFTKDNNHLVWDSRGRDIFYQGQTKEELPISVVIKYYLDGEETTLKKMLNKKGEVTIKILFENKSYNKSKHLHTPFVVTGGMMFDSTKDSDIKITNGEVVDTGTRSMAISLAAPGLYDDFKLEEFKSLDEVTISYKTTSFNLNNIYFVATPKLLEKIDITNLNKINTLDSSIKTIQENMDKIDMGAKSLNEASGKINSGSNEIASNLNKALVAIKKLEEGSVTLNNGLSEAVNSLEKVKGMLEDKNITGSLENIRVLIQTNSDTINLLNNTNLSLKGTYDNYQLNNFKSDEELITYFKSQGVDDFTINNLLTCKKTYEGNQNLIKLLSTNNYTLEIMTSNLQEIYQSVGSLIVEFENGLVKLESGSNEISRGLKRVSSGLEKLYGGSTVLVDGTNSLKAGADTLAVGISTLNHEGINKLTAGANTLSNYSNKVRELIKLSKDYSGYSSSNSNKTIFIYKVKSAK